MRTLIAPLTALMLFVTTPVAAGDWEDGLAAYDAGDYQKALRLWKPLAKWGVYPQVMLGCPAGGAARSGLSLATHETWRIVSISV